MAINPERLEMKHDREGMLETAGLEKAFKRYIITPVPTLNLHSRTRQPTKGG